MTFSRAEKSIPANAHITLNARITAKVQRTDGQTLVLKSDSFIYRGQELGPHDVYIYEDADENRVHIGDRIYVRGTFSFFQSARNPGNYDLHFHYGVRGIDGIIQPDQISLIKASKTHFRERLYQWGCMADRFIHEKMGEEYGSLVSSIVLGKKNMLDQDIRESYQKNGIAHILALSGLHLSLISQAFSKALKRTRLHTAVRLSVVIAFLCIYVEIAGGQIGLIRALMMFVIKAVAEVFGKEYDGITALLMCGTLILLRQPFFMWDVSYQLSFAAVTGIYLAFPYIRALKLDDRAYKRDPLTSSFRQHFILTVCVTLTTLPFLMRHFYEIAPYSLFLNLAVVPMMSLVLSGGICGTVCGLCIPYVGTYLCMPAFYLAQGCFTLYSWLCRVTERLPFHRVVTGKPPLFCLTGFMILLCAFFAYLQKTAMARLYCDMPGRMINDKNQARGIILMMAAGIAILGLSKSFLSGARQEVRITMLDIGQGDCIFVDDGQGSRVLIDGGSSSVDEVARFRIEPFLLSQGINRIDTVFVSHGDTDHISGISQMLNRKGKSVKIDRIVMTDPEYDNDELLLLKDDAYHAGSAVYSMKKGQEMNAGKGRFVCLGPPSSGSREAQFIEPGNEASLILLYQNQSFSMLFTGDVEEEGEDYLAKEMDHRESVSILKVAHHGSKNSTGDPFLNAVSTRAAVISAGINNRYGHPHKKTVSRLKERGIRVYCTKDDGAIMIHVKDNAFTIRRFCPN